MLMLMQEFQIRDTVLAWNFGHGDKWVPATITARTGLVPTKSKGGRLWVTLEETHGSDLCQVQPRDCGTSGHSFN